MLLRRRPPYLVRLPPLALPNVAVADLSPFMVNVQVSEVPLHAPLQPVNVVRLPGVAVSVMLGAVLVG